MRGWLRTARHSKGVSFLDVSDGSCFGGVQVVVDPGAVIYLAGTEMDFVQDRLGAAFKFTNPNEAGRCGCGESFTV